MSKQQTLKSDKITAFVAWIACILSVGLLLFTGHIIVQDIGSLRSCNGDGALNVSNCGKQSLNASDYLLFLLFVISAILVVSLSSVAWRMSRRKGAKAKS